MLIWYSFLQIFFTFNLVTSSSTPILNFLIRSILLPAFFVSELLSSTCVVLSLSFGDLMILSALLTTFSHDHTFNPLFLFMLSVATIFSLSVHETSLIVPCVHWVFITTWLDRLKCCSDGEEGDPENIANVKNGGIQNRFMTGHYGPIGTGSKVRLGQRMKKKG